MCCCSWLHQDTQLTAPWTKAKRPWRQMKYLLFYLYYCTVDSQSTPWLRNSWLFLDHFFSFCKNRNILKYLISQYYKWQTSRQAAMTPKLTKKTDRQTDSAMRRSWPVQLAGGKAAAGARLLNVPLASSCSPPSLNGCPPLSQFHQPTKVIQSQALDFPSFFAARWTNS